MHLLHKDGVLDMSKVLNTVLPGVFLLSVTVRWRSPLLTVVHTFPFTLSHFQFHTFIFTLSFSHFHFQAEEPSSYSRPQATRFGGTRPFR